MPKTPSRLRHPFAVWLDARPHLLLVKPGTSHRDHLMALKELANKDPQFVTAPLTQGIVNLCAARRLSTAPEPFAAPGGVDVRPETPVGTLKPQPSVRKRHPRRGLKRWLMAQPQLLTWVEPREARGKHLHLIVREARKAGIRTSLTSVSSCWYQHHRRLRTRQDAKVTPVAPPAQGLAAQLLRLQALAQALSAQIDEFNHLCMGGSR